MKAPSAAPQAPTLCSHSLGKRLSKKLAIMTIVVLGALSWGCWMSVAMLVKERNAQDLKARCGLLSNLMALEVRSGGEPAVLARLVNDAPMRASAMLQVWKPDGSMLYSDPAFPPFAQSEHQRACSFEVTLPDAPGGVLRAVYTVDFTLDAEMGQRWAWILTLVSLGAGIVVAVGAQWHVRRALAPLRQLASQTHAISAGNLNYRLELKDPAEELRPFIDQFNALMQRLEQAYGQLEGFNADVAHELRTPLATLIGETEVALGRERSNESLRDTLVSNLEEMQRLSAMVNDMLFLSQADRGAVARRGEPVSLAALAAQVLEFHEAPIEEAGLSLRIEGDARVPVDEALFKRALSNLVGNATRFADAGSTIVVRISATGGEPPAQGRAAEGLPQEVQLVVQNQGQPIAPALLPRLFDRFFRGESSRCCPDEQHHGLGLAIVAAIARMHAGRTLAESDAGVTRVGFTLGMR